MTDAELEERLRRSGPPLPSALRGRVLAAVRDEVRPAQSSAWSFAAAMAACLFIGLNLALTTGGMMVTAPAVPPPSEREVADRAAAIAADWPELGPSAELLARREFAGANFQSPWLPHDLQASLPVSPEMR